MASDRTVGTCTEEGTGLHSHSRRSLRALSFSSNERMSISTRDLLFDFWRLAWPAILRNTFNCAADRMTLAFVGHYDSERAHYDGASLGKMYSNITGLSVGFGLCLGLATLCSQANGAGRGKQLNGIYLRRCLFILVFAFGFSATAAFSCDRILIAMAQPADVAVSSARYAQVQLIGVPFYWVAQAVQTVCDGGLQDTRPGMYAGVASTIFQVAMCAICVHPAMLNWGYLGMAAARSGGGVVSLVVVVGVVLLQGKQAEVWRLPVRSHVGSSSSSSRSSVLEEPLAGDILQHPPRDLQPLPLHPSSAAAAFSSSARVLSCSGVAQFLCVALPGALMMWLEWWCFEGLSLMVGTLPNARVLLGAHGTLFNTVVVTYMSFLGLNSALCATVGKHIGGNTAGSAAPRLIAIALVIAATFALAIGAALVLLRDPIARFFEDDQEVVAAIKANIYGAALSVPGYGVLMTLYGACQGSNRQQPGFIGTALGYASGIPLGWYLGCVLRWPRPLLGVWLGNVWALAFASLWTIALVCCCIDWKRVRAVDSGGGEGGSEPPGPFLANPPGGRTVSSRPSSSEPLIINQSSSSSPQVQGTVSPSPWPSR